MHLAITKFGPQAMEAWELCSALPTLTNLDRHVHSQKRGGWQDTDARVRNAATTDQWAQIIAVVSPWSGGCRYVVEGKAGCPYDPAALTACLWKALMINRL